MGRDHKGSVTAAAPAAAARECSSKSKRTGRRGGRGRVHNLLKAARPLPQVPWCGPAEQSIAGPLRFVTAGIIGGLKAIAVLWTSGSPTRRYRGAGISLPIMSELRGANENSGRQAPFAPTELDRNLPKRSRPPLALRGATVNQEASCPARLHGRSERRPRPDGLLLRRRACWWSARWGSRVRPLSLTRAAPVRPVVSSVAD